MTDKRKHLDVYQPIVYEGGWQEYLRLKGKAVGVQQCCYETAPTLFLRHYRKAHGFTNEEHACMAISLVQRFTGPEERA